jgi:hypothetical protein
MRAQASIEDDEDETRSLFFVWFPPPAARVYLATTLSGASGSGSFRRYTNQ